MKKLAVIFAIAAMFSSVVCVFSQNRPQSVREQVADKPEPEMIVSDNRLTLRNAPVGKQVIIYSIIGNKLRQIEIKAPDEEHVLNLPRAIYYFKLEGKVKKFVIK